MQFLTLRQVTNKYKLTINVDLTKEDRNPYKTSLNKRTYEIDFFYNNKKIAFASLTSSTHQKQFGVYDSDEFIKSYLSYKDYFAKRIHPETNKILKNDLFGKNTSFDIKKAGLIQTKKSKALFKDKLPDNEIENFKDLLIFVLNSLKGEIKYTDMIIYFKENIFKIYREDLNEEYNPIRRTKKE